jgi:hypothetical protein
MDNSKDFESKINELILKVAWSIGIDVGDRLRTGAKKFKFVVNGPLPPDNVSPVKPFYLRTTFAGLPNDIFFKPNWGKF